MCNSAMLMSSTRRRSEVSGLEIRERINLHGVGIWRDEMVEHHTMGSCWMHGRLLHETMAAMKGFTRPTSTIKHLLSFFLLGFLALI